MTPGLVRLLLVLGVLCVIALLVLGMLRGWRARGRRQDWIPQPGEPPRLGEPVAGPFPVQYVATTLAGDWLDRVVVHGLGRRGRGTASVHESGVLVERVGEGTLFIPAQGISEVRLDRGLAQRVFEAGGLVVITWQLGPAVLDTGLRGDDAASHLGLARAVGELASSAGATTGGRG